MNYLCSWINSSEKFNTVSGLMKEKIRFRYDIIITKNGKVSGPDDIPVETI